MASTQDEHGYSLVHAAASYNHLDLLRALVTEFKVDVDLKDEDGETALFVVETPAAASILIDELGANLQHRGAEGLTARQKIETEGDFPDVAKYLTTIEASKRDGLVSSDTDAEPLAASIPPPPEGMSVTLGIMDETTEVPSEADPEFRRRIEELAQHDDLDTPQGQARLRVLVIDALADQGFRDDRNVKSRQS